MNVIALGGTLQSEPELRYTQDGLPRLSLMLNFVAEREGEGEYKIRVIAFGDLANEVHQNYHHGDSVFIQGRLQVEKRSKPSAATREEMEIKETVAELVARKFYRAGGLIHQTLPVLTPKASPSAATSTTSTTSSATKSTAFATSSTTQSTPLLQERKVNSGAAKQTNPTSSRKTAAGVNTSEVDEFDTLF